MKTWLRGLLAAGMLLVTEAQGQEVSALYPATLQSMTCGTGLSGGTITTVGVCSLPNVGTAGSYSNVTTDAQGRVTAGTVRSVSYNGRALNSCFQISATRDAVVSYTVDISATLTLVTGAQGTVYLRSYTNSSCSAGAQQISRATNGNTGTLTVGLNLTQTGTAVLTGIVPGGLWAQLVTENTSGTPTFTFRSAQEVLL